MLTLAIKSRFGRPFNADTWPEGVRTLPGFPGSEGGRNSSRDMRGDASESCCPSTYPIENIEYSGHDACTLTPQFLST